MNAARSRTVRTARLATHIREAGDGVPILFVHGNLSDGSVWDEQLSLLPSGFRGIAPDLRGFGAAEAAPVDATRGVGDFRDDLVALLDALGLDAVHLVGHSLGGGIVLDFAVHHPGRVLTLTPVAPVPPYGYGGTRRDGTPCAPDYAGSGGGTANPELVRLIAEGDESDGSPLSPRNVVRTLYFPGPEAVRDEEALLKGILAARVGDDNYPGTSLPSPNWPGVAPGSRGVLNAISPKYFHWSSLPGSGCRAPVLWVYGDLDAIVSDTSMTDLGHLGASGYVPGWPGAEAFPAQPMVQQTRDVLDRYGDYTEHLMKGTGHFPYTQRPEEFAALLHAHLSRVPTA
ncbi:alpha/beta fold hydrolase [Sphaerisporangium perillae]|uniref:alpha/beta fold hydrolase n=1 Tax=Sphaerisporangium perillae TaxID=2935860 RepID=UPI00200F7267|nr:alpha/beta hydrolase [Sphaerisporangium perillae]